MSPTVKCGLLALAIVLTLFSFVVAAIVFFHSPNLPSVSAGSPLSGTGLLLPDQGCIDSGKDHVTLIQGTWDEGLLGARLEFRGDQLRWRRGTWSGDATYSGSYELRPPGTISWRPRGSWLVSFDGTYKLDVDRLTLEIQSPFADPRGRPGWNCVGGRGNPGRTRTPRKEGSDKPQSPSPSPPARNLRERRNDDERVILAEILTRHQQETGSVNRSSLQRWHEWFSLPHSPLHFFVRSLELLR
jgi:hypothetical protein